LVVPAIIATVFLLSVITVLPLVQYMSPRLAGRLLPVGAGGIVTAIPIVATHVRPGPRSIAETGPRRVALALELGPADAAMIEHFRAMALPIDARIALMHVAESAASRYLGPESLDEETREDLAALEQLAAELRQTGLHVEVILGNGDVKSELARIITKWKADLVVTGSHGHRWLGDLFLGATTSGLRHRVSCPVLTIRADRRGSPR
jgi:manganese transport protein